MNELCFGIVIDIDDPLKAQRVKVRVMGYYDEIPEEDLPWCQVCRGATETIIFNEGAASHTIEPGTQVLCAFLDYYHQQPIVLGSVPRVDDCNQMTDTQKQRILTKQGHEVIMSNDGIQITDNKGNIIKTSETGIDITIPKSMADQGNSVIKIDNELNVTVKTCNLKATDCNIETDNCNLKVKNCKIDAENCELKCSGDSKIDASSLSMKNIKGPNQFCCLPNCLFAGTKHIAPSTD